MGLMQKAALLVVGVGMALGVSADPYPPTWNGGAGASIHYAPVAWPTEPANPANCGATCGDWKPYTRFQQPLNDPRVQDPSNGGTSPQAYVNVSSSCADKTQPSIYYALHQGATPAEDVLLFRWRVESAAHNYATGPSAGNYGASNPWSSALWTVLFDLDGTGYRSLAAHLDGSSGAPATPIDRLVGIWGQSGNHSLDYVGDPTHVKMLGHNPTAFIGPNGKLLNFNSSVTPSENWPNGSAERVWDYGSSRATLVTQNSCTEYFIDYQIPVALLDASAYGGPSISRSTPISMLFCTANSLNNPFQKDCAINKTWGADASKTAPFGDYISFNQQAPYSQPIVKEVTATPPASCPGSYSLQAKVQDTLALQSGVVVSSVQQVQFYYWYDANSNGQADDAGSQWQAAGNAATLTSGSLNQWQSQWDASDLPKGKYLIGVQALDDNSKVDDGMTASGVNNRTFSYIAGDSNNQIYIAGSWISGQQASFPAHLPSLTPSAGENWYGNPAVTGQQVAVIGTAINACGVAPSISYSANKTNVVAGGVVQYQVTVSNPSRNSNAVQLQSLQASVPPGFNFVSSSTSASAGLPSTDPSQSGSVLSWAVSPALDLAPGDSAQLQFQLTAGSTSGSYSSQAQASTSFAELTSESVTVRVDAASLALGISANPQQVTADGATSFLLTLNYQNTSGVTVTNANISLPLASALQQVSCSGGTSCAVNGNQQQWSLGDLAAGATGSVTVELTLASSYGSASLGFNATLAGQDPASVAVQTTAATTVSVSGYQYNGSAGFVLSKSANQISVAPGGQVTYSIQYQNYGDASASNVVITDTLPSGMSFVSASNSGSHTSGVVQWTLPTVAAGSSGTVTVTVAIANPFTANNPTSNQAQLSWDGGGPIYSNDVDVGVSGQACSTFYFSSTTGNVGPAGVQKLARKTPVPVSGDTGSSVLVTAPVAGAAFLEALRFYQEPATEYDMPFDGTLTTSMYIDRANGSGLNIRTTLYDYNSSTGATTQLAQSTTLFGGSTKGLLQFNVTPSGTLQKNHRLMWVYEVRSNHNSQTVDVQLQYAGTVSNSISGGSTFANSNANFCITPPAALTVSMNVDKAAIAELTSQTLQYQLHYANTGSTSASNTSLGVALPSTMGQCEYSSNGSTWANCLNQGEHLFSLGTVAGGASGTLYIRGTTSGVDSAPGQLTAQANLSSDQTATVSANASTQLLDAAAVVAPELSVQLKASPATAVPGDTVTYQLTVLNTGNGAASNLTLADTLPVASYYSYGSCSDSCSVSGNSLSWSLGSLAVGASTTVSYQMVVGSSGLAAGTSTIDNDATATATGVQAQSNVARVLISGNPQLALSMTATPASPLAPADLVDYSISLTNQGSTDASDVLVAIPVPAGLAYVSHTSPSQGSAQFDGLNNQLLFTVGTVTAGQSLNFSLRYQVQAMSSTSASFTTTATATASNAASAQASVLRTAAALPVLAVDVTASGSSSLPAATVRQDAVASSQLLVDRTQQVAIGQQVLIGSAVRTVQSVVGQWLLLDSPVTVSTGTPVYGAVIYHVNYQNQGNLTATSTSLTLTIPTGLGYASATGSPTSTPTSGNAGTVSWTLNDLKPNDSQTLDIVTFPTGTSGKVQAQAVLDANEVSAVNDTVDWYLGGLRVEKQALSSSVQAGSSVVYQITVTNELAQAASGVVITDLLPAGFSYQAGSAQVNSISIEPSFDAADTEQLQPSWSGLTVPAQGQLQLQFTVDIAGDSGGGRYQNDVQISASGNVGIAQYDTLASTTDDVTVLGATDGLISGLLFERNTSATTAYDSQLDTPLNAVTVQIYQAGADCNDVFGAGCYIVSTNGQGEFQQVVPAGDWRIQAVTGTGDLDASWNVLVGSNNNLVQVVGAASVDDQKGFGIISAYVVTFDLAGGSHTGGGNLSQSVASGGAATAPTLTPPAGKVFSHWSTSFTNITGNLSVTAVYVDATYTVTFDLAGGTHTGGGDLSQTVTHGGAATAPTLTAPAGKIFSHWSTSFTNVTGNLNVTAVYVDATYTVTFDLGGGTHTGGGALSQTVTHGGAATAPTLTAPAGKVFSHWSTSFTNVTGNLNVTAVYVDATYTVTFDLGGGSHTGGGALSQTVTHGGAATAPTLTAPAGKVFSHWSTSFTNVTGNLNVTAVYVDATYTVTFDLAGGTHTGGGDLSQTVTHGGAATAPTLTAPTGKVFSHWSTSFTNITGNLNVTAVYVDATYTVTFDLGGGSHTGGGALSQTVTHGGAATAPTLTAPAGKVFSHWSTSFNNITGNLNVTAVYVDATYTVTFDLGGGTHTGGGDLSQTVTHGGAATAPTLTAPTGKVFSHWSTSFNNVTGNLNVTAVYVDATYTVTFDLGGGTHTGGGALSQTVTHGGAATAPTLTAPTGKVFSHWSSSFDNVTGNLSVTAVYVDATYTVTFDLAGGTHTGGGALSQTVTHGGAATAPTLTPPAGKVFSHWSTSFDNVTGNLTVTAVYQTLMLNVAVSADTGGQVSPAGAQQVAYGESLAISISANSNYSALSPVTDCAYQPSATGVVVGPVTENCQFTATFAPTLRLLELSRTPFQAKTLKAAELGSFIVEGGVPPYSLKTTVRRAGDSQSAAGDAPLAALGASLVQQADGSYRFQTPRTGLYQFEFTDQAGQLVTAQFSVTPMVAFTSSHQYASASNRAVVSIELDDDPIDYPVRLSSEQQNYWLADGLAQIVEWNIVQGRQASIDFMPLQNSDSIRLTLQANNLANAVIGSIPSHQVELVPLAQQPLALTIVASQQGNYGTVFPASGGQVILESSLPAELYTLNWSASAAPLQLSSATSTQVPSAVASLNGRYLVQLTATEKAAPNRQVSQQLYIRIVTGAVPAAYNQFNANRLPNQLPICIDGGMQRVSACQQELKAIYLQTMQQYQLAMGRFADPASWRDTEFATSLEIADLVDDTGAALANRQDLQFTHLGYRIDFELSGLERAGMSVPVVVPLKPGLTIPAGAVWRTYIDGQGWKTFEVNSRDQLASAKRRADGSCPWAGGLEWQTGLNVGDDCIRLIITDGGPNDRDGVANGTVRDPSVLAVAAPKIEVNTVGKGASASGGAGLSWLMGLLLGLVGRRYVGSRSTRMTRLSKPCLKLCSKPCLTAGLWFSLALLALPAKAEYQDEWLLHVGVGQARGEVDAATMAARLADLGYQTTVDLKGLNRTATEWRLDYRFNPYLSLQVGQLDFGKVRTHLTGTPAEIEALLNSATFVHPRSADGWQAGLAARYPLTEDLQLQVGLYHFWQKSRYLAWTDGAVAELPRTSQDHSFSIGLGYQLSDRWQLTLDYRRHQVQSEQIPTLMLGLNYRFWQQSAK